MNRIKLSLLSSAAAVAAMAAWSPSSFAARQIVAGPGITPIAANGIAEGVDMTGSAGTGTLTIGTVGGPQTDIFSDNNPVGTVPGVAVSTDASSTANILFNSSSDVYGDIGITQPGGPFFLGIVAGASTTTVNYLGNVFATTLDLSGTGDVNFLSGGTNITATNFAADGTITLAPNTTVIGALTTTAGANTGTLNLGGGSVLDGAVGGAIGLKAINVLGGTNTAGITATITGAVDAYAFSLGTNTLNIDGALTLANLAPSGVINTTLASPTVYGNIRPVGATNLGPTLTVNALVPASAYIPVGTQFNIVQTRTGTPQSGTDSSVVVVTAQVPTNPLYTFSPVPPAGTVAGLITIEVTGIPITATLTPPPGSVLPPSAPIAAVVVPALTDTPVTPDLTTVLAAINAFSDPADVVLAETQLAPSTPDFATPLVTFQGIKRFEDLWSSRLFACSDVNQRDKQDTTCQENAPHSGWWLKGYGYFGEQDARTAFDGYDSRILGTMLGFDAPIGPNTRAGLGVGYEKSRINGEGFDTDSDFNTYQAMAYIGHESGPLFIQGSASFGWNEYSKERHIAFTGVTRTAEADYDGQDYTAMASAGYHIPASGFTITPLASLQYTYMKLDGYTETGAGDVSLKVNDQNYSFIESGLGVKVDRRFSSANGTMFIPEMHFKWLHEIHNPSMKSNAAFNVPGAVPFTTPDMKTADDTFNIGAGITLLSCNCSAETWALEAVYDHDWTDDGYDADQAMVKFSRRF